MRICVLFLIFCSVILSTTSGHAQGVGIEGSVGSAYPIRESYNITGSASTRVFYELYSGWQVGLSIGYYFVELYRDDPFKANENRTIHNYMVSAYSNNAPYASQWKYGMLAAFGIVHSDIYRVGATTLISGKLGGHCSWYSDIGIFLKAEVGMQTTFIPLSNNGFILFFANIGAGYFLEL